MERRLPKKIQMSEWRKNGLRKFQIAENDYQPPLATKIDPQKTLKKFVWIITINTICIGIYDSSIKARDFIINNFPIDYHNQDEFIIHEIPFFNIFTSSTVCLKKVPMNELILLSNPN